VRIAATDLAGVQPDRRRHLLRERDRAPDRLGATAKRHRAVVHRQAAEAFGDLRRHHPVGARKHGVDALGQLHCLRASLSASDVAERGR